MVERALAHHLVEGHVGELGSGHRSHEAVQLLQAGEGRGIRHTQFLTLPPHGSMGTECTNVCQGELVQIIDDSPERPKALDPRAVAREE